MSSATQNCEFCGSPAHVWFACTKKPDGWKPDRLKTASAVKPAASSPDAARASDADGTARRQAKKSTAARKDVHQGKAGTGRKASPTNAARDRYARQPEMVGRPQSATLQSDTSARAVPPRVDTLAPAGTQAPPVDTLKQAEAAAAHLAPKRGRPKTITDMRAYKREKERKRRAAKKAGK